jgi:lysophospholipase L1-like esterase
VKTILAYGDSLTFGSNPIPDGPRHAYEDRWPSVLEAGLGGQARVIAEGLGGRTTVFDDWGADSDRNGARILPTILSSHSPLDLVIFMLGTNDIKHFLGATALEAANGMRRLVEITRGHYAQKGAEVPKMILVCPPQLTDTSHPDLIRHFGSMKAIIESKEMPRWYKTRADELGVGFFDASTVAKADPRDGVHLDAANTRAIGDGLVPLVKKTLGL